LHVAAVAGRNMLCNYYKGFHRKNFWRELISSIRNAHIESLMVPVRNCKYSSSSRESSSFGPIVDVVQLTITWL